MHGIKENHLKKIMISEIRNVTEFARERTDEFAEFISQKSNSSVKGKFSNADKSWKNVKKDSPKSEWFSKSFMKIMSLEQSMTSSSECCHRAIPRNRINLRLIFRSWIILFLNWKVRQLIRQGSSCLLKVHPYYSSYSGDISHVCIED